MVDDRTSLLRGTVIRAPEAQLTDEFVKKLGYAFSLWLAKKLDTTPDALAVSVGRDSRASGERIQSAFAKGLTAADSDVYDCGLTTTPAIQMSLQLDTSAAQGACMITASAAGEDMNGFKLFTRDGALTGEEMGELLALAESVRVPQRLVSKLDITGLYAQRLAALVREFMDEDVQMPLLGLHVVVDASNGSGGFFAEMLKSLGVDIEGSFALEPTGRFSGKQTNPEDARALERLSRTVVEQGADLGVMLDVDADRVAIVDANGKAINRNRLIALIAAILLEDEPNLTFVTDSVTSSGLSRFITEWGGTHYRFRRGHRNVIDEARRLSAEGINVPVAIETSGHAAMAENYFIDDGMYLATKVICEAKWRKRDGLSLSSLIDELPEPVESLEVRMPLVQQDYRRAAGYVIEAVLSKTLPGCEWRLAPDNREGVRILFSLDGGIDNAWFMLRLSVHDPVMVLNAESEVPGGLKHMMRELYAVLAKDNEELDLAPLEQKMKELGC